MALQILSRHTRWANHGQNACGGTSSLLGSIGQEVPEVAGVGGWPRRGLTCTWLRGRRSCCCWHSAGRCWHHRGCRRGRWRGGKRGQQCGRHGGRHRRHGAVRWCMLLLQLLPQVAVGAIPVVLRRLPGCRDRGSLGCAGCCLQALQQRRAASRRHSGRCTWGRASLLQLCQQLRAWRRWCRGGWRSASRTSQLLQQCTARRKARWRRRLRRSCQSRRGRDGRHWRRACRRHQQAGRGRRCEQGRLDRGLQLCQQHLAWADCLHWACRHLWLLRQRWLMRRWGLGCKQGPARCAPLQLLQQRGTRRWRRRRSHGRLPWHRHRAPQLCKQLLARNICSCRLRCCWGTGGGSSGLWLRGRGAGRAALLLLGGCGQGEAWRQGGHAASAHAKALCIGLVGNLGLLARRLLGAGAARQAVGCAHRVRGLGYSRQRRSGRLQRGCGVGPTRHREHCRPSGAVAGAGCGRSGSLLNALRAHDAGRVLPLCLDRRRLGEVQQLSRGQQHAAVAVAAAVQVAAAGHVAVKHHLSGGEGKEGPGSAEARGSWLTAVR